MKQEIQDQGDEGKELSSQPSESPRPALAGSVLDKLIEIFDGKRNAYDEDGEGDAPDDLFRSLIQNWPANDDAPNFVECGSTGGRRGNVVLTDTPSCLYRLLFLVQPEKVNFSDMYKSEMFSFCSADRRFLVKVYLFKYELGLYFYCAPELIEGSGRAIWAGMPGSNNGTRCKDPIGQKFFEMVAKAANYKWMVYGGNDFEV